MLTQQQVKLENTSMSPIPTGYNILEFYVFLKILEHTGAVKSKFLVQEFNLSCNLGETLNKLEWRPL